MRTALPLIALILATGAAAQQDVPEAPLPLEQVAPPVQLSAMPPGGERACTDRIHQARAERGLPRLERGPAIPDQPLLIAAVDRRIDGCSVMVMLYDTRDIRPLPTEERPGQLERIPGG